MISADLIIRGAGQVITCTGTSGGDAALAPIDHGAVAAINGTIIWAGPEEHLDAEVAPKPGATVIDAQGGLVTPGYVDAHTHLVFAGDRAREFSLRSAGATYQELLAAGGGIHATVRATRAASHDELVELTAPRLRRLLAEGVTTCEIKSGYGLTIDDELKMLRVVKALGASQPVKLVGTALPLHALPPDVTDRAGWIARMLADLLPVVEQEDLARFVDVFVEKGAFTADEARLVAREAKKHDLRIRLHVDQLTSGAGAELAAELKAATADHLEEITPEGIEAMAQAGVAATLLPVSTLYLKCPRYAPGRALADAGVTLALGSNVNPGSAMSETFSLALSLACLGNGLSAAEAFYAATAGGAAALGYEDRGQIVRGRRADLVVHGAPSVEHLAYHMATSHVRTVVIGGRLVHEAPHVPAACS